MLSDVFNRIDEIKEFNQIKVLDAFREVGIQNLHYSWVTGYGYDDLGKDTLDNLYAKVFNTEKALVRPGIVSGTHAIVAAIWGNLNAGDSLVCLGKPYDTLLTAFKKYQKKFKVNLNIEEKINPDFIRKSTLNQVQELVHSALAKTKPQVVFLQRSRGYEWRDSYRLAELKILIDLVKNYDPKIIVFVDNCYGEFTQKQEPSEIGADLIAGSLIKNPGAGIVAAGAYIAGKSEFVDNAAEFITAPGIGAHGACMFDQTRLMFQGLFLAPLIVSEALKGMTYAAKAFQDLGLTTIPTFDSDRNDIIQSIKLNSPEALIKFCSLVQKYSPVNSIFSPVPDEISGYDDQIIMASGSFIEGSSIELSCDGPLKEPYVAYLQGGLSWAHTKYVIDKICQEFNSLQ